MTPNEKMEALCNLGPHVGLRVLPGGKWVVAGVYGSDGTEESATYLCYSAETPLEAIEKAWAAGVAELPSTHHLLVDWFGPTKRRARWDSFMNEWADVTPTQPSTPAT